jgi:hypothetical protein
VRNLVVKKYENYNYLIYYFGNVVHQFGRLWKSDSDKKFMKCRVQLLSF